MQKCELDCIDSANHTKSHQIKLLSNFNFLLPTITFQSQIYF
ncbi:hypothetical protein [Helicobacter sp. 23-1045]